MINLEETKWSNIVEGTILLSSGVFLVKKTKYKKVRDLMRQNFPNAETSSKNLRDLKTFG